MDIDRVDHRDESALRATVGAVAADLRWAGLSVTECGDLHADSGLTEEFSGVGVFYDSDFRVWGIYIVWNSSPEYDAAVLALRDYSRMSEPQFHMGVIAATEMLKTLRVILEAGGWRTGSDPNAAYESSIKVFPWNEADVTGGLGPS